MEDYAEISSNGVDALQAEVRSLRRELKQKQRLIEQKDFELQTHISTLSHEVRTPLVSIRGFASLLLEDPGPHVNPEALDYLRRIISNVDRMELLFRDILMLSRLNIHEDSFEVIDIGALLADIILNLHGEFQQSEAAVHVQPDISPVFAYRPGIRHVFTNLITNALRYGKKATAPHIEIGCECDELFLKYYVKDNGIGIPACERKNIFQPFVRLGAKRGVRGNGLGLTICRRIIMAHGGEIWATSQRGQGSTFFFTIPNATARRLYD